MRPTPLLDIGVGWDYVIISIPVLAQGRLRDSPGTEYGAELSLLNLVSLRGGHITKGSYRATTRGYGLGFALGDILGVRFHHATIPQVLGRPVERIAVSSFIDVVALRRHLTANSK